MNHSVLYGSKHFFDIIKEILEMKFSMILYVNIISYNCTVFVKILQHALRMFFKNNNNQVWSYSYCQRLLRLIYYFSIEIMNWFSHISTVTLARIFELGSIFKIEEPWILTNYLKYFINNKVSHDCWRIYFEKKS